MGAYEGLMRKKSVGAGHGTGILQTENGQKVDEFKPIYFGEYRY